MRLAVLLTAAVLTMGGIATAGPAKSAGSYAAHASALTSLDAPPVAVDDAGSITEGAVPNRVLGNVLSNDSDPDGDALVVTNAGTSVAMAYGTLDLKPDGSYSFTLNNDEPAVNALNDGDTLKDTFTYGVADGKGGTDSAKLAITINGATDNAPPVAVDDAGSIKENAAGKTAPDGGATTPGPGAPAKDTAPPSLRISAAKARRALKRKAIIFRVTANESCRLTAHVKLGNKTLVRTKRTLPGGATSKIRLRLGNKARAALRKALRGRSQVTVVLVVTGVDTSDNTTTSTKKLRLKR